MKKLIKKIISLSLSCLIGFSFLTSEESIYAKSTNDNSYVEKPKKISVYTSSAFGSQIDQISWEPWLNTYEEITGIEIELNKEKNYEYYRKLALMIAVDEVPDVIELAKDNYATYVREDILWDMTEVWENSELKASGKVNEKVIDQVKIDGKLYGFPISQGNGTVTYVRQDWLDNLNIEKPTNYDEFIEMLRAFTEDDPDQNGIDDTCGITMPGIISSTEPYTIYLREFYQDARAGIYQKEDGTWVDGMLEPEMKASLERIQDAYKKGYIDPNVITNRTSTMRSHFYYEQSGVVNYWAGQWGSTLQNNLMAMNYDAYIVPLSSIAEAQYIESVPNVFAITKNAENPEGIFKYFIEYSHDGGEGELLFSRGVNKVHYKINADGTYQVLKDIENELVDFSKAFYSSELTITDFKDPININERITQSLDILSENPIYEKVYIVDEVYNENIENLLEIRDLAINSILTDTSVEEALVQYEKNSKDIVSAILNSLNNK